MRLLLRIPVLLILLGWIGFSSQALPAQTQVYFNVATHKVHQLYCPTAHKCTKNCILLPRAEAYRRGGIACKVCGG